MANAAAKRATYQDVLDSPEHIVAEVIEGVLYSSPRPSAPHAVAASALGGELFAPFKRGRGGPGGWIILDEPELHLEADIVVPDLAGWRRTRMPAVERAAFFTLAPDWICEVLSPSTEKIDRALKLPIYARAGVDFAWLVNPDTRTLEVMRRQEQSWVVLAVHKDDDVVHAEPFEAIALELAVLWADVVEDTKP
jgi:Uma2 family endonuclease